MKRILCSLMAVFLFALTSMAQTKAVQTVKINTPSIQCDQCKKRVETYLKRYDGVLSANVNVKQKVTTVKFATDRTNEEEVKTAIANAGYDANDVSANPDAYKRLPECCKKPEGPRQVRKSNKLKIL